MAKPVYFVGIEFVPNSFTNLTSGCVEMQIERQLATIFDAPRDGHLMMTLVNDDSRFSPQNSASPFYPYMIPGKTVKVEATHPQSEFLIQALGAVNNNHGIIATPNSRSSLAMTAELDFEVSSAYSFIDLWTSGWVANGFAIYVSSNQTIGMGVAQSAVQYSAAAAIALNTRYLAHLTWTGSIVGAFLNGVSIGSNNTPTSSLTTGAITIMDAPSKFYGVRYWNRALTRQEIGQRAAGYEVDPTGLILNADFTRRVTSSGDLLRDLSPASNQITMQNSFIWPASTYPLFRGRITNMTLSPTWGQRVCLLEAGDDINRLQNTYATTSLYAATNAGSLFTAVMSLSDVASFSVQSGNSVYDDIPFAWANDEQVSSFIQRVIGAGNYPFYADGSGTLRLQSRAFQQGASSVGSYSSNTTGFDRFEYATSQESVRNKIKLSGKPRVVRTDIGTIAWTEEQIAIPASGSVGFILQYIDTDETTTQAPAIDIVTPVASTDWTMNTLSGGGGSNVTATASLRFTAFGESAVCSLFNGTGQTAFLTRFNIRGRSAQEQPVLSNESENNSSQALYGRRSFALQNDLLSNQQYVEAYANYLVYINSDPTPKVNFGLKNEFPDVLAREIGDIVSLVDSITAVNSQWQIIAMQHTISMQAGLEHSVNYDVRQHADFGWLILDSATRGILDQNRLGF